MELSSHESCAKYFGFRDLHACKDFVSMVIVCAPDGFFEEDWLAPDEQLNLDRAFVGLRYGLQLTAAEKGESELLATCRGLVDAAYAKYQAGDEVAGQAELEKMEALLKTLPSQ